MSLMEQLQKLHLVDAQVRGLERRLASARRYLAAQQIKLDAVEGEIHELETRRRQLQAKIGNFEGEMATIDERIASLREKQNQASTSKQYTALVTEVNTLKADRSAIETKALADMVQVDELNTSIEALQHIRSERVTLRDSAQRDLDQRQNDVGERLEQLQTERKVAAGAVPGSALRIFDELAEEYDGEAMASIEIVDRRHHEYACGSCNMHLPIESIARLMGNTEINEVLRCPACRRILFLQEETRGAMT